MRLVNGTLIFQTGQLIEVEDVVGNMEAMWNSQKQKAEHLEKGKEILPA